MLSDQVNTGQTTDKIQSIPTEQSLISPHQNKKATLNLIKAALEYSVGECNSFIYNNLHTYQNTSISLLLISLSPNIQKLIDNYNKAKIR